jgi:hypothetical protein
MGKCFPFLFQVADMSTEKNSPSQDILNLIGDEAFTRLCMVFGGTRLPIADSERSRQRLSVVVGEALAEKIIHHYRGEALEIPKLSNLEVAKRHQAIINDMAGGMSTKTAAIKYDMTQRSIRKIANGHSEPDK